jgi:hypothetical protein
MTSTTSTFAPGRRAPATVRIAAALLVLLPLVTAYGAFYFTFVYDGGTDEPLLGALFVAFFWAVSGTGLAAGIGLLRGGRRAGRIVLGYCLAMTLWTVAKLVFWHETESVVFGVAALTVAALTLAPATGRHLQESSR